MHHFTSYILNDQDYILIENSALRSFLSECEKGICRNHAEHDWALANMAVLRIVSEFQSNFGLLLFFRPGTDIDRGLDLAR